MSRLKGWRKFAAGVLLALPFLWGAWQWHIRALERPRVVCLSSPETANDFTPTWSPKGDPIVFCRFMKLYRISPDGRECQPLLLLEHTQGTPAFSPDGRKLAFSSSHGGSIDLWVMDLETRRLTRLTHDEERDVWPAWSPDGKRILFTKRISSTRTTLFLLDLERGEEREFCPELSWGRCGSWSPDGKQVVFVSSGHEGESRGLWVAEADGTHPRELYQSPGRDDEPCWSPDGRFIAFSSDQGGVMNLWLLEVETKRAFPLTFFTEGWASSPCFSPDGEWIVFARKVGSNSVLSKVKVPKHRISVVRREP